MRKKVGLFFVFIAVGCFISCNEDDSGTGMDDETNSKNVTGTIRLSGEETSIFGTTLEVGNIAVNRLDLIPAPMSVALLPENTTITDDSVIFEDPNNGFNIAATDLTSENLGKAIGMVIAKDSIQYAFFCDSPVTDGTGAIECGENYRIDFIEQQVIFDNTTVINVESRKTLVLDGIVSWE